jgi:5-methylcytosine-specific restriction endonuclease McrA
MDPRREEKRRWRLSHSESVKRSNRKQYLKNLEKRRAYARTYHAENRESRNAYNRKYCKERYPKIREILLAKTSAYAKAHPEVRRRCFLNYVKNHPDKYKAHTAACHVKRSAAMRGAKTDDPKVSALIRSWKLKPEFTCRWCGVLFPREKLHIDHIIPVSKGGKHECSNVCESCWLCNIRKRNKELAAA